MMAGYQKWVYPQNSKYFSKVKSKMVLSEIFLQCLMGTDSLILVGPFFLCKKSL